jgi:hypothetical protein
MTDYGNPNISGNVGSNISFGGSGSQTVGNVHYNGDPRDPRLEKIDALVGKLLAGIAELPPDNAADAAREAAVIKQEVRRPAPNGGKLRQAVNGLARAAAPATELIELARQIADLVGQLAH